jgi:beta-ribofuranosylaminobenzene 5'-phosphate synthase
MMPRGELISGEKERAFFAFHTPIATEQVLESLAAVWHGLVPAFLEADLNLLRLALKDLSSCGLKKQEIEAQSESRRLIDLIAAELALPVGMSSLGPLVFCVSEASMDVTPRLRAICNKCDAMYIGAASPANHGFLVS